MARHTKPKKLSEADVEKILADAKRLMTTINLACVRTDTDQFRAMRDINEAVFEGAKIIAGSDRPWPIYSSTGPC
ncbi:MAG: hypothetical protein J0I98_14100 [Mesorhizobium sp.]|nr:hypothetical protein [Mesorhizobium sp.]MBN9243919.1 hypothetical protein [Mesorhizobium sp.]